MTDRPFTPEQLAERPAVPPLYYECDAAKMLGIDARALRSEREKGNITYRKVAGRIMYRADDLTEWQEGVACRAKPKAQSSGQTRKKAESSTSTGRSGAAADPSAESVQRALAIVRTHRGSSRNGSTPAAEPQPASNGPGLVVPLRQE